MSCIFYMILCTRHMQEKGSGGGTAPGTGRDICPCSRRDAPGECIGCIPRARSGVMEAEPVWTPDYRQVNDDVEKEVRSVPYACMSPDGGQMLRDIMQGLPEPAIVFCSPALREPANAGLMTKPGSGYAAAAPPSAAGTGPLSVPPVIANAFGPRPVTGNLSRAIHLTDIYFG